VKCSCKLPSRKDFASSITFDTGGEFPDQAKFEPASLVTMADVGTKSLVSRPFGWPEGFVIAITMRSNASPPVSKVKESRLPLHMFAVSVSNSLPWGRCHERPVF
jgi:hypothetical protein